MQRRAMTPRKIRREGNQAGVRAVYKEFVRFCGDSDQGFFVRTPAEAETTLIGTTGSDLCFDFEGVTLNVGRVNFLVGLLD